MLLLGAEGILADMKSSIEIKAWSNAGSHDLGDGVQAPDSGKTMHCTFGEKF